MKTKFMISIIAAISIVTITLISIILFTNIEQENEESIKNQGQYASFERLLSEYEIEYESQNLVVEGGPAFAGDPGCGAVIDNNFAVHWFSVDSLSNPQNITLYSDNPNKCRINYTSCFCNAQMSLAAKTLEGLSYFNPDEEKFVENTVRDYLSRIDMAPGPEKFVVGKFNFKINPDDIPFCGAFVSEKVTEYYPEQFLRENVTLHGYFQGVIRDKIRILDFHGGLDNDNLCAINSHADIIHFERDTTLHDSQ